MLNKINQRAKQKVLHASNQFVATDTPPLSPSDDDLHAAPLEPSPNVTAALKRLVYPKIEIVITHPHIVPNL